MLVAPDRKAVVAVCAGYNQVGVNLVRLDAQRQTQFIPLEEAFNGLAFSRDGKQFYVSGGDRGTVYVFDYADGKAALNREVHLKHAESSVFLAGMAVHPSTGVLYICNEANHEIWAVAPDTMRVEKSIEVGQHPHCCLMGGDGRHLYVSNWGGRSVSVVDTAKARRVRDVPVGVRPNDMALAPDGRLFVACSGDNTVHVIATEKLEQVGPDASPAQRLWEAEREIISTSLYPQSPEGSTPCGVAVSPDGRTLFVANADNNAVMVADISGGLMEEAKDRGEMISLVERIHSHRLVSQRGGRVARQPVRVGGQRQGSRVAREQPAAEQAVGQKASRHPLRSSGQDVRGLDLVYRQARHRADGRLHCAGAAQFAVSSRAIHAGAACERHRHSRESRRSLPDQVRALHHQGEPHLRPGSSATCRTPAASPSATAIPS